MKRLTCHNGNQSLYPLRTIITILFLIFSWALYEQKYKKIIPKETIGVIKAN